MAAPLRCERAARRSRRLFLACVEAHSGVSFAAAPRSAFPACAAACMDATAAGLAQRSRAWRPRNSVREGGAFDAVALGERSTAVEYNSVVLLPNLLTADECAALVADVEAQDTLVADATADSGHQRFELRASSPRRASSSSRKFCATGCCPLSRPSCPRWRRWCGRARNWRRRARRAARLRPQILRAGARHQPLRPPAATLSRTATRSRSRSTCCCRRALRAAAPSFGRRTRARTTIRAAAASTPSPALASSSMAT